jgi:inosine/xanthosine triphosphate pyrophosphatase family protein
MVKTIVLATRNSGKVREFQQLLKNFPVEIKNLSDFGPIPEVEMPTKRPCSQPKPWAYPPYLTIPGW